MNSKEESAFDECIDVLSGAVYVVSRDTGNYKHIVTKTITDRITLKEAYQISKKKNTERLNFIKRVIFITGRPKYYIAHYKTPGIPINVIEDSCGIIKVLNTYTEYLSDVYKPAYNFYINNSFAYYRKNYIVDNLTT